MLGIFKKTLPVLPTGIPVPILGCDPELFLRKDGGIVGSERAIPENGIEIYGGKVVRDGVQVELNPKASYCRALLGENIHNCFHHLAYVLTKEKITPDFSQLIKIDEKELGALSSKSKTFGCMPSFNAYHGTSQISVDASVYHFRSAGGHIHFGSNHDKHLKDVLKDVDNIVPIFDIIVGNTCVLLDRDEGNIERRKNYGKAGEFRVPEYGVEYRTTSNFWLKSYQLYSLVFGLARLAVAIAYHSDKKNDYARQLRSLVDINDIEKAINENNFDLAYSNFKKIEQFILDIMPVEEYADSAWYPLNKENIEYFHHFVKKGMDYWFKDDPLEHWVSMSEGFHGKGWESFVLDVVKNDK